MYTTTEITIVTSQEKLYEEESSAETTALTSDGVKVSTIKVTEGFVKLSFRNMNVPIGTVGFNSATLRLLSESYQDLVGCLVLNCHNTSYTINYCPQHLAKVCFLFSVSFD